MTLHEHERAGGVEPGREQQRRDLAGAPAEVGGVVGQGHRVEVDDAVDRLVGGRLRRAGRRLRIGPAADRAGVIAEVHLARRLDPREHACHCGGIVPVARVTRL